MAVGRAELARHDGPVHLDLDSYKDKEITVYINYSPYSTYSYPVVLHSSAVKVNLFSYYTSKTKNPSKKYNTRRMFITCGYILQA